MKNQRLVSGAAILLALLAAVQMMGQQVVPIANPSEGAAATQQLLARIGSLESQLAELDKRVQELESRPREGMLAIPGSMVRSARELPSGSTSFRINGATYYAVPFSGNFLDQR